VSEILKNLNFKERYYFIVFLFLFIGLFVFLYWSNFKFIDYPKNCLKEPVGYFEHLPFDLEVEMDANNECFMFPFIGKDGHENILRIIGCPYGMNLNSLNIDVLKRDDANILQLPLHEKPVFSVPIVNSFVDFEDFDHFQKDLSAINDNPEMEINGKGFNVKVKKISSEYFLPKGLEATISYKKVKLRVVGK
jgi:hypothetical protein